MEMGMGWGETTQLDEDRLLLIQARSWGCHWLRLLPLTSSSAGTHHRHHPPRPFASHPLQASSAERYPQGALEHPPSLLHPFDLCSSPTTYLQTQKSDTMATITEGPGSELTPNFAPFFGMAGIASAMIFGCIGAAYGTAKSGIGIAGVGTYRPDLIMKSLIPVVMSGIIAVYALVIAVLIAGDMGPPPQQNYSLFTGFMHLASGLSVGLAGLAAGYAIGIVGDMGVRCYMQQSRIFVGMVLILIFGEVLGLYGLIVGLILHSKS
ncbi:hypothetical protein CLAIMM_07219 isoform 4 [Cladophialophora immunda]|nr:hypothetical protein CLAIMM_07219 isoform 4 [Cladophialophora immunda]